MKYVKASQVKGQMTCEMWSPGVVSPRSVNNKNQTISIA